MSSRRTLDNANASSLVLACHGRTSRRGGIPFHFQERDRIPLRRARRHGLLECQGNRSCPFQLAPQAACWSLGGVTRIVGQSRLLKLPLSSAFIVRLYSR